MTGIFPRICSQMLLLRRPIERKLITYAVGKSFCLLSASRLALHCILVDRLSLMMGILVTQI